MSDPSDNLYCTTWPSTEQLSFEWKVTDFDTTFQCKASNPKPDFLHTPPFSFSVNAEYVKPHMRAEDTITFSVSLEVTHSLKVVVHLLKPRDRKRKVNASGKAENQEINAKITITLLKDDNDFNCSEEATGIFRLGRRVPFDFSEPDGDHSELLAGKDLKIRCEVVLYGWVTTSSVETKPSTYTEMLKSNHRDPPPPFGPQMESLLNDGFLSDFTLVVPVGSHEREFAVHKLVLAAHSPVFKRMIETDMKEKKERRSTIDDIRQDVLQEMIMYMYTGKLTSLKEMAEELFAVADKYEIVHLKSLCEECLCERLTPENAISTLLLADMHSADGLRAVCVQYVEDHMAKVRETYGWCELKENQGLQSLYVELLETQLPPRKQLKS